MTLPFAVTSPSETLRTPSLRLQRTEGAARIAFKYSAGRARLDRVFQSGAAKVRFPHVLAEHSPEAVLINTAGGLTGGDRMAAEVRLDPDCRAVVTTQACEKIYRAASGSAEIRATLTLAEGARLDWLPQETILFDGARLARRLDAELAPTAELLVVEATLFGRAAHGETMRTGLFTDRWRIRRGGRLVFADDLRFDWARPALLARPAVLAGAGAMATVLLIAAEPERHLDRVRVIIGENGGASAWDGKLVVRLAAPGGMALRQTLVPLIAVLRDGAPLPRMWRI